MEHLSSHLCGSQLPLSSIIVSKRRIVLVIASRKSINIITAAVNQSNLSLVIVEKKTMVDAENFLKLNCDAIAFVVSALGRRGHELLFDCGADRSTLIRTARQFGIPVVVFSQTVCGNSDHQRACFDAGACATVCDQSSLLQRQVILDATLHGAPVSQTHECDSSMPSALSLLHLESTESIVSCEAHLPPTLDDYIPLQLRTGFERTLHARGNAAHELKVLMFSTNRLKTMIEPMLPHLILPPGPRVVKFVVISDTHSGHRRMVLPEGEVLIHCGDIVGNYGDDCPIVEQLLDFAAWIKELPFRAVYIVAGNHDTILDNERYPNFNAERDAFLAALPAHAVVLNSEAAEYRGIRLWGSPTLVSRFEAYGERYYSDGNERTLVERNAIWKNIPESLDVLITHTPCSGASGDSSLGFRLAQLDAPPSVHVYGHDHGAYGCGFTVRNNKNNTVQMWINAAQNTLLNKLGGGFAWVFDRLALD